MECVAARSQREDGARILTPLHVCFDAEKWHGRWQRFVLSDPLQSNAAIRKTLCAAIKEMSSTKTAITKPAKLKDLTRRQLRYLRRKAAGLCCYGTCPGEVKDGAVFCNSHLRQMVNKVSRIHKRRTKRKLCRDCGTRPHFWGTRCIICRQLQTKDPLPRGARQALRKYRAQEAQGLLEQNREKVRSVGRQLVAGGTLSSRQAEALKLYLGLEDNSWRSHKQVARLMHLSAERVRQLLIPPKQTLQSLLGGEPLWRSAKRTRRHRLPRSSWPIKETSLNCEHSKVKILRGRSVAYTAAGLPNVFLSGIPVSVCRKCKVQTFHIPRQADLHDNLARSFLSKKDLLSGNQIRFLRRVARLNEAEFAARLDITRQTVQKWESSQTLRLTNEITVRAVLTSLILDADAASRTFKLTDMIPSRTPKPSAIEAQWVETLGSWKFPSD